METSDRGLWKRFLRLSLRSLIVLIIVIAGWLGWIVHRARVQREAVMAIERAGDIVWYDWEWKIRNGVPNSKPWWPKWLADCIGVDYLADVTAVYARHVSDAELAHIGNLSQLEVLLLPRSRVTDAGLAHLKGLHSLRALNLQLTKVSGAGLAHLKTLTGLRELGLGDTDVSDADIPHLEGLSHLTDLNLEKTKVTGAGIRALRKAMPKARIRRYAFDPATWPR